MPQVIGSRSAIDRDIVIDRDIFIDFLISQYGGSVHGMTCETGDFIATSFQLNYFRSFCIICCLI